MPILLHRANASEAAIARLKLLRETNDGFKIAEADYTMRGGGDFIDKQQSGEAPLRMVDPTRDDDLLKFAYHDAAQLVEQDSYLASPRGQAWRCLLRIIFGEDYAKMVSGG